MFEPDTGSDHDLEAAVIPCPKLHGRKISTDDCRHDTIRFNLQCCIERCTARTRMCKKCNSEGVAYGPDSVVVENSEHGLCARHGGKSEGVIVSSPVAPKEMSPPPPKGILKAIDFWSPMARRPLPPRGMRERPAVEIEDVVVNDPPVASAPLHEAGPTKLPRRPKPDRAVLDSLAALEVLVLKLSPAPPEEGVAGEEQVARPPEGPDGVPHAVALVMATEPTALTSAVAQASSADLKLAQSISALRAVRKRMSDESIKTLFGIGSAKLRRLIELGQQHE